jgi:nucleolar MIF4G domain-containing protein 1
MLLDSYVVLHAALISSLQKIIGIEFGTSLESTSYRLTSHVSVIAAYFVQHVVASYEQYYASLDTSMTGEDDTLGKECSNLIVLLSELYNFQVISCVLVFDIVRQLLDAGITEMNVELLLKIVRSGLLLTRHTVVVH